MEAKTNLRKLAAELIFNAARSAVLGVTQDARNPYAFTVTLKDPVTGATKTFRTVTKEVKAGEAE